MPPTKSSYTVAERLKAIEESGWELVFDGCHKIYFLTDEERKASARSLGYEEGDFFPSAEVRTLYKKSCPFRFVSKWGLDNTDFAHPLNIDQFEED